MLTVTRSSILLLAIIVMAITFPLFYGKMFAPKGGVTQLFYSPVIEKFIFREHLGEHAFRTEDEAGNAYERKEFESLIPFIYYKNMDLWGKLPLTLHGKTFDKKKIKASRQVFELKAEELPENKPRIPIYPLLESNPKIARLIFPEDVFRMQPERMEFINVDINKVDEELTSHFNQPLKDAGFVFPARLVSGRVSILKPYDVGYFLVDATGATFHLKRVDSKPQVQRTSIPTNLNIRHIKVMENKKRESIGLLLTHDSRLFLIGHDDYALTELPTDRYNPDTMRYKLILNPVFRTATYWNDTTIHGRAMSADYQIISSYQRTMPIANKSIAELFAAYLFPFELRIEDPNSRYFKLQFKHHGITGLVGVLIALVIYFIRIPRREVELSALAGDVVLIILTGVFGLIAALFIPPEPRRGDKLIVS